MAFNANNKVVLVTGVSSGIGNATVWGLVEKGFTIFATVRSESDRKRILKNAQEKKVQKDVHVVLMDVSDDASVEDAFLELATFLQKNPEYALWGVVNNAGIAQGGPLSWLPVETVKQQLDVNVLGPLRVTQHAFPWLKKSKGRVVMVSSISGAIAFPYSGPYCASKHALDALSESWAVELQPFGVHISIVAPGSVKTPIWQKATHHLPYIVKQIPESYRHMVQPALDKIKLPFP